MKTITMTLEEYENEKQQLEIAKLKLKKFVEFASKESEVHVFKTQSTYNGYEAKYVSNLSKEDILDNLRDILKDIGEYR